MLAIVLKVLSILGIVLLAVLAVMLLGLALVLFFPFTYRLSGSKDAEGLRLSVKVNRTRTAYGQGAVVFSARYENPAGEDGSGGDGQRPCGCRLPLREKGFAESGLLKAFGAGSGGTCGTGSN